MQSGAFLVMLAIHVYADGTEGPTAGCNFDEDSNNSLDECQQGNDDDFDWHLVRTYSWPQEDPDLLPGSFMLVNSSQHAEGARARLSLRPLSENDTHCVQFSYFLYSRDGHSPGALRVFVRVNGGPLGSPVWNASGSHGRQWHQVELAISTFWPSDYQVLFEAFVSQDSRGYVGLDDILLLNYPCHKVPHFSRLGDVEVNAGQNATFQCVALGRASELEQLLLEEHSGPVLQASSVWKTSHRRSVGIFMVDWLGGADQAAGGQHLYRCVSPSARGAAVSNFAQLIVKVPPSPTEPPQLLRAGPTYLIIQLNTDTMLGDGPVIRRQVQYRAGHSTWAEIHGVSSATYKVWHLEPDTEYHISALLTRPGPGGTGPPGPPLVSRTRCAEPMRAIRDLRATEIQSRQLTLQWEPLGYNLTRCHSYTVSLCYHYSTTGGGGVQNATVRECLTVEQDASRLTLRDLPPFRPVHVRLALANPEGSKEGREVTFQTEEDVPGVIATESLTFTPLDDMVFLKWEEPVEPNGLIIQYEISYQSIESSDPGINVPGPRRVVSKLRNETYHVFSSLQPGTTYLVSVRAQTAKGFGLTALTEITTNISAPAFDYEDAPAMLAETESTVTVLLRPAQARGAPISTYQVVVELEEEQEDEEDDESSRQVKRELSKQECFPTSTLTLEGGAYCSAELPPSSLPEATPFTVGDNRTYNGCWNTPLDPRRSYAIYFQAISHFKGEMRINCIRIARKACRDHRQALEVSQHSEEMGLIVASCAGGLLLLTSLLGLVVILIKKCRVEAAVHKVPMCKRLEKPQDKARQSSQEKNAPGMEQSALENGGLQEAFLHGHSCAARKEHRHSMNESSSLLGRSPQQLGAHMGSLYPKGQLRPAVRVADLLQHISQMKTAEGYGFKQEYESFFSSRDGPTKKGKTTACHDSLLGYDHHRVKLHPLLGDTDGVGANYIDIRINREGYHRPNHFIATQGPKQDAVYDFWRTVWEENSYSIVMLTKLVELGRVKCHKYWPDDSTVYCDIKITLLKMETLAEYTVRTFCLERRGFSAKQEVRQFHFTSWPEHGVPIHATGLLAFLRRVKADTPSDSGPLVVHCSAGAGRTGCYVVLDVMLDMAECEGVVDIYNCVRTLCSHRINMIQSEEQYVFIHEAILEACLCGETAIPLAEFAASYTEMLRVDPQSNSSHLREEFQTLNSVTPHLDVEECSMALLPRNRQKNRSMDVLPPDHSLALLTASEDDATGSSYVNAALASSFHRPAAFIVTPHPLANTTADFWRLVFDYGCSAVVMLNQLNQSNSAWPCLQYWPEPGLQHYGPMQVEFLSRSTDDDVVTRLFRVKNLTRLQEGQLLVRQFQFLRWSAYREVPDSRKAFLGLLGLVLKWQGEAGEGRTVVHCLNGGGRSGTFCTCIMLLEMMRSHGIVDIFYAVKTLRNSKPNMVESLEQYRFCYELALEYLACLEAR
ncbi:receptor-type tyrosine-protein phosphatase U-like isoform X2 [Brienomyrus brachyistius]|uniref:receptor-type tyrosine-protein phosphatase U-like isoform X2 n=1 Tax=Brienomyrus brachyistius TaxID=42636 RepID=UPI0020B2C511|nr:receptor-type tyrosine-protein phosphatase U-like isoform X2 [Brienomyrus brachyistius]